MTVLSPEIPTSYTGVFIILMKKHKNGKNNNKELKPFTLKEFVLLCYNIII